MGYRRKVVAQRLVDELRIPEVFHHPKYVSSKFFALTVNKEHEERMAMKVVDHRGHLINADMYHPRSLLEPGKKSYYLSGDFHGPLNEDWMIFGVDAVPFCITRIGIRNDFDNQGIKRISIEGSPDNKEY